MRVAIAKVGMAGSAGIVRGLEGVKSLEFVRAAYASAQSSRIIENV